MKNVLIIGNGFDLDLGLPTKYSDFAGTKDYWPKIEGIWDRRTIFSIAEDKQYHALGLTLDNQRKSENWFDLEESLLNYASKEVATLDRDLYSPKDDIKYYHELQSKLCDYLTYVQNNKKIRTSSTAVQVLKAVLDNGYFTNIFSFNYTDLNYLAKQMGIQKNIEYTHIHGKLSDRSIILGVNEAQLNEEYDEFHKSTSEFYRSNNLAQALDEANEIVFYGFSFGLIDFDYFSDFFKSLTEGLIPEKNKKHISIFTKDVISQKSIVNKLRSYGVNQNKLNTNSILNIYHNTSTKEELDSFYKRLKDTSLEAHNRNLQRIASQLQ